MENIIEATNSKKKSLKQWKIIAIFFAVITIVLAVLVCFLVKNISSTDLIYENMTITSVEQESVYVLKSNEAQYRVFVDLSKKITNEQFEELIGQTIQIARFRNFIYGIETDTFSFDALAEIENANKTNLVAKIVICAIALVGLAVMCGVVYIDKKTPFTHKIHFLEQDYFKKTASNTPTSNMLKKRFLLLLIPFAVLIALVIFAGSKDDTSVKFYIFISLFIAYFVFFMVYTFIHKKIIKKKNIEFCSTYFSEESFEELYKSYPEDRQFELEMMQDINNPFVITTFEEEGVKIYPNKTSIEDFLSTKEMLDKELTHKKNKLLKVDYELYNKHLLSVMKTSFEERFIPYEILQLKLECSFYPNGTISAFVTSSLPNDYLGLKNDLFFLFSPTFYQEIKRKNIKVKGLDNFFQNILKLMNENCNNTTKIIEI